MKDQDYILDKIKIFIPQEFETKLILEKVILVKEATQGSIINFIMFPRLDQKE